MADIYIFIFLCHVSVLSHKLRELSFIVAVFIKNILNYFPKIFAKQN